MTKLAILVTLILLFAFPATAQKQKTPTASPQPKLTRTTIRNESSRLGYGGTVTLIGAPDGSITIEGWSNNEVEVHAEIQLHADSEKDLDELAAVNGFILDEDLNHLRILTAGMHDRAFMKKRFKNFPKRLLNLPWRIDYRIRVPLATDLDINGGRGPITVKNVDGNIRVYAPQSDVSLRLSGGTLATKLAAGSIVLKVDGKNWRRGIAELAVATGNITLELPSAFKGDIDADILRTGTVENSYEGVVAREKAGITPQLLRGRIGTGGGSIKLTVGDGQIRITKNNEP